MWVPAKHRTLPAGIEEGLSSRRSGPKLSPPSFCFLRKRARDMSPLQSHVLSFPPLRSPPPFRVTGEGTRVSSQVALTWDPSVSHDHFLCFLALGLLPTLRTSTVQHAACRYVSFPVTVFYAFQTILVPVWVRHWGEYLLEQAHLLCCLSCEFRCVMRSSVIALLFLLEEHGLSLLMSNSICLASLDKVVNRARRLDTSRSV